MVRRGGGDGDADGDMWVRVVLGDGDGVLEWVRVRVCQ